MPKGYGYTKAGWKDYFKDLKKKRKKKRKMKNKKTKTYTYGDDYNVGGSE